MTSYSSSVECYPAARYKVDQDFCFRALQIMLASTNTITFSEREILEPYVKLLWAIIDRTLLFTLISLALSHHFLGCTFTHTTTGLPRFFFL